VVATRNKYPNNMPNFPHIPARPTSSDLNVIIIYIGREDLEDGDIVVNLGTMTLSHAFTDPDYVSTFLFF